MTYRLDLTITDEDHASLAKLRDEIFPQSSLSAIALKCMRDELVRCGVRKSGDTNRSRGARRTQGRNR